MLFVHHDGAQVAQGGEQGRAGAHGDALLAGGQEAPLVVALAVGEGRVEHGDVVAEPRPEAGHRLGREGDLGDQYDGGAARGQHPAQKLDVDPGLPRSGDAVEEQRAGGPLLQAGGRVLQRGRLVLP